jgi:hypothetical protein
LEVFCLILDYEVVNRIFRHLKLTFIVKKLSPGPMAYQKCLIGDEVPLENFS